MQKNKNDITAAKKPGKTKGRLWLWFSLIALTAAFLMYFVLPHFSAVAEYVFARGLFRLVSYPLGFVMSLLPFSLTEIVVVLALPALLFAVCFFVAKLVRSKGRRKAVIKKAAKGTAVFLSGLLCMYMLMHGANFYRYDVKTLMQLEDAPKDKYFLQAVCIDLAQKLSAERENLQEDENGCMILPDGVRSTLKQANKGYKPLYEDYSFLAGSVWRGKYVFLSYPWSYTGITGMYFPWLAEANVNIDQPHSAIPATAAHELAHTRGFAREDECNFFAFLSCAEHPQAQYRYSGYLMAYVYCQNELFSIDIDLWSEARSYCSEAVERDLLQRNAYIKSFEGPVEEFADKANDAFITSQGVEEGIESYSQMVELVLAWYQSSY